MLGHAISNFTDLTWKNRLPGSSLIPKELGFLKPCLVSKAEGDVCGGKGGAHSLLKLTWD